MSIFDFVFRLQEVKWQRDPVSSGIWRIGDFLKIKLRVTIAVNGFLISVSGSVALESYEAAINNKPSNVLVSVPYAIVS